MTGKIWAAYDVGPDAGYVPLIGLYQTQHQAMMAVEDCVVPSGWEVQDATSYALSPAMWRCMVVDGHIDSPFWECFVDGKRRGMVSQEMVVTQV